MDKITCGFIGLGLIGGSIAKALRAASNVKANNFDIVMIAADPDSASIDMAINDGVLDNGFPMRQDAPLSDDFSKCDIVFLCAPVSTNARNLPELKKFIDSSDKFILITDVGSVKGPMHEAVQSAGLSEHFVGGHPMAGSERFGYRNSSELLLQNAYYILTPEEGVPGASLDMYIKLVEYMGAIPLTVDPAEHDRVTAAISHLPHVLASALVNLVKNKDSQKGLMKTMAAGGFKDITRIASSSPDMWEQICLQNGSNILEMLDDYVKALGDIREKIVESAGNEIHSFFDSARIYRDSFIEASYGPIKKAFDLFVNIADEPGVIAQISTTLALHQVNIKNVGIIHNRELAEGALRIEFYNDEDLSKAQKLLSGKGYEIYTK